MASSPRLLVAALWLAACSSGWQAHAAEGTGSTGNAFASPPGSNTKGTVKMSSTDNDVALVRRAVADEFRIAPGDVKVDASKVAIPGITVFMASVDPAKAGRHASRAGIVEDAAIYTETEAMSRVARAWGYGIKRTVPPATVAQVFGQLHRAHGETATLLGDLPLKVFKQNAGPKRAAAAQLPSEAVVDGFPAVVYCLTSSVRSVPFSVVTAIVKPDFQIELRVQPVLED